MKRDWNRKKRIIVQCLEWVWMIENVITGEEERIQSRLDSQETSLEDTSCWSSSEE